MILSAVLLAIKSPVRSAFFKINLLELVLDESLACYSAKSKAFWLIYHLHFESYFCQYFYPYF